MKTEFPASSLWPAHEKRPSPQPPEVAEDYSPEPDSQVCEHETQPTSGFAADLDVKPQSVRKRYSETGSFWGIKPIKLPSGHLRWPRNPVKLLARGVGK